MISVLTPDLATIPSATKEIESSPTVGGTAVVTPDLALAQSVASEECVEFSHCGSDFSAKTRP